MAEGKEQGIQVLYKDETVWATQKAMAVLFDCSADNIGQHLSSGSMHRKVKKYKEYLL